MAIHLYILQVSYFTSLQCFIRNIVSTHVLHFLDVPELYLLEARFLSLNVSDNCSNN
ncbi:hypothetical protein ES332_A03G195100v1 [Gossypium tomentosum]|uniref:Uncharacterized protein n=1 Tax=Gossypium tomentosum TaxID=34277 RepID=A0A5D2RBJ0_GOSTO|nr:hypothetical protein ES332_A03G195100v1 [Gossypium tomentosum]